jgi:hypothetical protein
MIALLVDTRASERRPKRMKETAMKNSRQIMRRVRKYGKWAFWIIRIALLIRDIVDAATNYRQLGNLMLNYMFSFERKPGRWVYVPTKESIGKGKEIVKDVLKLWKPPSHFYHIKRRGGHLGAAKKHSKNQFIANRDVEDFFGSITRAKLNRALIKVGMPQKKAFDIACSSCVVNQEKRPVLPYGFVQSMILASLVLDQSAVGVVLRNAKNYGVLVTVYVDDIILSSKNEESLVSLLTELDAAAATCHFAFAEQKCSPPSKEVINFNCRIGSRVFQLTEERMAQFKIQLQSASDVGRDSILGYVRTVNKLQHKELLS